MQKNLQVSKKSSTFAPSNEKDTNKKPKNTKIMKAKTALKNLEKAVENLKQINGVNYKMRTGYKLIVSAIENKQTIIRPAYYSGRGRFTTIMDHTGDVQKLLNAANIKFDNYNDAPRGSATGEVYLLTHIVY